MNNIIGELGKSQKFIELVNHIEKEKSPITISGLVGVGEIQQIAAINEFTKKPICLITYNEIEAKRIFENLQYFTKKVTLFPKKEIVTYDYVAESKDLPYQRIETLNKIVSSNNLIVVTTIEAIMQTLPTKETLYKNKLHFKIGKEYNLEEIKQKLVNLGYTRYDIIEGRGQFSIRGDIIDISLTDEIGMRIELWGDEVDSIRKFNIVTQRSVNTLQKATIYPAHEYVLEKDLNQVCQHIEDDADVEQIKNSEYISKIDKYFDCFYDKSAILLDYLSNNYIIALDEISKITTRAKNITNDLNNLFINLKEKEKYIPQALQNMLTTDEVLEKIQDLPNKKIYLEKEDKKDTPQSTVFHFNYKNANQYITEGKIEYALANNRERKRKKRKPKSNQFNQGEKVFYADLKIGDYVVHRTSGIGIYVGVSTIEADGMIKDYIKIKYKNNDILYVPTNQMDSVRKYIGEEGTAPKINRLGSKEWEKTKAKVKNNLREVARDLIELYAKREKAKGFAFSKDTPWQAEFEEKFPYIETEDQLRCIEEVKHDMELQKPMDRLLCGDVGYGKTEVAIRAAFKAVMDQKQVAYLAPTTILADQQYNEFAKRMEDYPIRVALLNRFKTAKEQQEIVKKLKLGEIDIIIGTHRILSKDVEFKDLGLLIIDEEHRFGVKHKEKIKQYKTNVDVLTMTATPIPRTLHMSIVGVRDMSVIYEPPHNRKPVQTYVLEYDKGVVQEAITRELERDGQVFYLYNNVQGIESKVNQISELVPDAKISYAHGQMTGSQVEKIMKDFIEKKTNVLVCTTILESGIDIPNANTIIVENADRMGLAQLYQIRGRVGRAERQAYAYITYRKDSLLSEIADKRLRAIREFTEFGSGFKIAMRDLEIRGAGSLLGELQSGHLEQVGYDTYCNLLDEVIKEMKGIEVEEEQDIQIDLDVSSYIPDRYISDSKQKIEVYQNIALCKNENDIREIIDELIDRYGNMPKEVENLINVARIKYLAKQCKIEKISSKQGFAVFTFKANGFDIDVEKLLKLYGNKIKFSTGIKPKITLNLEKSNEVTTLNGITRFLKESATR